MAVGCAAAGSQTILFDSTTHAFKTAPFSGTDAVVYDLQIDAFLLSGAKFTPKAFGLLVQTPLTSPGNDHSVDGGQLPNSLVNVVGVPEPGALPALATGMAVLAGLALRRRLI